MTNESAPQERRRDQRISPKGTAIVRAGPHVVRGRIADLSRGGLSLVTASALPEHLIGCGVDVAVRLDVCRTGWFELRGRIQRVGPGWVAVSVDEMPEGFARMVDETVTASHRHERVLSMVLVDAVPDRREQMTRAFRRAGCTVIDVSTPLEAIVRLGELDFEPDLIAIADSFPASISDELRRFVDNAHHGAILVTIGDAQIAPPGVANWLSSTDSAPELAARVRDVLTAPHPR